MHGLHQYVFSLSASRSAWVKDWTLRVAASGKVGSKEMEQALGRLGFTASALLWERPLYEWSAAIRGKPGVLQVPSMVRAILRFIGERFGEGGDFRA